MSVIEIKKLNKIYKGGFQALFDIDLEIKKGEVFALLGPNGAGKTSLISIISGLANRTSGEVFVMGKDVDKDYKFTRQKIGLVQQEINADFFLTIRQTLLLQAGYFGLTGVEERIDQILKDLSLWDKKDNIGRALSGGMKRRVMIAKALVHDPDILFLDEPTAGVDIELRENLWDLVRKLQKRGKTIILTTHYLEEAEEMADRIGMISGGKIVLVEEKEKLMNRFGKQRLVLKSDKDIRKVLDMVDIEQDQKKYTVQLDKKFYSKFSIQSFFEELSKNGIQSEKVSIEQTDLNDIYKEILKKQ